MKEKEYAVTLISEDGPYFNIYATDFEITRQSITRKPYMIVFGNNNETIARVPYKDVYEIAEIINDKLVKIKI